jgi:hypothetical protein
MFALALSILLSLGIASLWRRQDRRSTIIITIFAIIMAIDLWPIQLPTTPVFHPAWTTVLRNLPLKGPIISQVDDRCLQLYYQTLHERPMAFGYISRSPASVDRNDRQIVALARAGNFAALRHDLGFVYVVVPRSREFPELHTVYSDDTVAIQELPDGTR